MLKLPRKKAHHRACPAHEDPLRVTSRISAETRCTCTPAHLLPRRPLHHAATPKNILKPVRRGERLQYKQSPHTPKTLVTIIGINSTKDAIFVAETLNADGHFQVTKVLRVQFEIQQASDLYDLLQNFSTILSRDVISVAILKCSGGQYGASVEAIKAEAIVELTAHQKGLPISMITPQSLKKALACGSGEKWQDKSKLMFNSEGEHKYWAQGANGAVCAAYKLSQG